MSITVDYRPGGEPACDSCGRQGRKIVLVARKGCAPYSDKSLALCVECGVEARDGLNHAVQSFLKEMTPSHVTDVCASCGGTGYIAGREWTSIPCSCELPDPPWRLVCHSCGEKYPKGAAQRPDCCRHPKLHIHNTRQPCPMCSD